MTPGYDAVSKSPGCENRRDFSLVTPQIPAAPVSPAAQAASPQQQQPSPSSAVTETKTLPAHQPCLRVMTSLRPGDGHA